MLHPLLAQDDADGDHHQVKGEREQDPGEDRADPFLPRYGGVCRVPFVEPRDRLFVVHDRPAGEEGVDPLLPVVFGAGVVERPGRHRGHVPGETAGRQGVGDQQEDVDDRQLAAVQRQGPVDGPENNVGDGDDDEEQEYGTGVGVPDPHLGAFEHHVTVGNGDRHEGGRRQADGDGPQAAAAVAHHAGKWSGRNGALLGSAGDRRGRQDRGPKRNLVQPVPRRAGCEGRSSSDGIAHVPLYRVTPAEEIAGRPALKYRRLKKASMCVCSGNVSSSPRFPGNL